MTGRARAWLRWVTIWVALAGLAVGCRREPAVATALEASGTVERETGATTRPVVSGTELVIGDTLRTGAASQARLALVGGGVIRVGEHARLRFQRGTVAGQQAPDIAVELGSAELEELGNDLSIVTAVGPARIQRGTRVRVRADGQTASLEVVIGRAVMLEAGKEVAIDAGQGVRIRLGSPEIQRFALKVGTAVVETPPAADAAVSPPEGAAPGGEAVATEKPGPRRGDRPEASRADFTLAAGESATLHDGRPPAAVRLRVDQLCPGGAIVEVSGDGRRAERFSGTGGVVLRLRPGKQPYRVRCAGDGDNAAPRASGVLSLRRDMGYVPLARRAPADVIDADGRRYTVLFQTRLPQLTLAWPAAPAGTTPELHLASAAGERVVPAASPRRPLPTGTLKEGTYSFWYSAPDGKRSPKTTLNLRFDNAAPTAQFFRTSADAGKGVPGSVTVDGVTVEGAKVSVGGQPLAVDAHGRFRTEATPTEGDDAVAVRLEHPRTGIHYYVRRP